MAKIAYPTTERGSLTLVLDASGSMATLRADTIGGFNTLIQEQQKVPGECDVTLVTFRGDPQPEYIFDKVEVQQVPELTEEGYRPGGGTALLDCLGTVLSRLKEEIETARPASTSVVIITDGYENASRTWTREKVAGLIQALEAQGVDFVYLGANIDVFSEGGGLGLRAGSTFAFSATSKGVQGAYSAVSARTRGARTGDMASVEKEMVRGFTLASEDGTGTAGYDAEAIKAAFASTIPKEQR